MKKVRLHRVRSVMALIVVMIVIGSITVVAAINTVEVIFRKDTRLSNVITPVVLTTNESFDEALISKYRTAYPEGFFGVPKKIKFPESNVHYDITTAQFEGASWKATKGLAHVFIVDKPIQKMFGDAVIYMRSNTPTTKNIGGIMSGDVINVVTTEGWQLGYEVEYTAGDPSELPQASGQKSRIVVVLIDEHTGEIRTVSASLSKVGERI